MDPLTAEVAAVAGKTIASEAMAAQGPLVAESSVLSLDAGLETAAEAHEAIIGEQGLIQQLDSIRFESMDALAARNEVALRERLQIEANRVSGATRNEAAISELLQVEANRIAGAEREKVVYSELADEYPAENGNHIEKQCSLRDEGGKAIKDPETGKGRIVDAVVIKDGQVIKSVEVTSETADKTTQLAKEDRIREAGGNYVEDRRTGEFVPFRSGVETEVVRRA